MASFDDIRALRPGTFKIVISPACERIEKDLVINFTIVSDASALLKPMQHYYFVCICPKTQWYFNHPSGIAVDSQGNIYVADTENHCIQKFTESGTFISKWGKMGIGDGEFEYPHAIAVDSQDNVYVNGGNHTIKKFTSTGTFISKWGYMGIEDGEFSFPHGIAIDSNGDVYVTDERSNRIQKFTSSGAFITKWGSEGSGDGQFKYPKGIAVDSEGNVYVADSGNNRIQKFAPSKR